MYRPILYAAILLTWASLPAQVPYGYLAVVETSPTGESRVYYVDPETGVRSELRATEGEPLAVRSLAVDSSDPTLLHVLEKDSKLTTSVIQGSRHLSTGPESVVGPATRVCGRGLERWLCVPTGGLPGLWAAAPGIAPTLLLSLPGAQDLTIADELIYVSTYSPGLSSRIDEVDLVSGQTRTLGTGYPPILSLGGFVGQSLLAGTADGELLSINRFTGQASSVGNTRLGAVTAIASDPVSGLSYFATENAIYRFGSFSQPVYTTAGAIDDLDVGVHDQSSWVFYGDGCPGTGASVPEFTFVEAPRRGETFTIAMSGGAPQASAVLVAGFNREVFADGRNLPFPVSAFVPWVDDRCMVLTDLQASAFTMLDAIGQGQLQILVPDDPSLVGVHATWQWAILDPGASGGLVTSHGAEAIIR